LECQGKNSYSTVHVLHEGNAKSSEFTYPSGFMSTGDKESERGEDFKYTS
jgi:hypothetical protein